MRELDILRNLMPLRRVDIIAVSASLDQLPIDGGSEIAVVIAQARRALTEVSFGKDWYKPLLRHAIKRLVDLFEQRTLGGSIGPAKVRLSIVGDIE